jgi:hypothetical protein
MDAGYARSETGMADHNAKHELHQLVDQLPAEQIAAALRYMHYLSAGPVLLSFLNAPPDDEPYTEQQCERDAEAEASIAGGGGVSHQEVLREFGL